MLHIIVLCVQTVRSNTRPDSGRLTHHRPKQQITEEPKGQISLPASPSLSSKEFGFSSVFTKALKPSHIYSRAASPPSRAIKGSAGKSSPSDRSAEEEEMEEDCAEKRRRRLLFISSLFDELS